MIVLSIDQIVFLHGELIRETGGVDGLRDKGLLESAVSVPFQNFFGFEPYQSVQQKAARLGYGLVSNHPFVDGNKRIGAHAMLVFLSVNGIELEYSQDELADMFLRLAAGGAEYKDLLQWITEHEVE